VSRDEVLSVTSVPAESAPSEPTAKQPIDATLDSDATASEGLPTEAPSESADTPSAASDVAPGPAEEPAPPAEEAAAPAAEVAEPAEEAAPPAEEVSPPDDEGAAPAAEVAEAAEEAAPPAEEVAAPDDEGAAPAGEAPAPADQALASEAPASWGRVDDDGTVSVREGDQWRVVGQYPDGSPEEALQYYQRKFADLAGEVTLLEVRHRRGGASAADLRSTLKAVRERVSGASAVGDLAALEVRLSALDEALSEASAEEAQAHREAVDAAIAERTTLVEEIEAIAARDPKSIQWKQTSAEVTALFERWQAHQSSGPRLPKNAGQQLWKRFRDARAIFDKNRREFYAGLDETHKAARDAKTKLAERAEALSSKGEDGIAAYRNLLDEWKSAGRAGKKVDDALWARFKAAGDALYAARAEREQADTEASKEKIEAKRALLAEAGAVPKEKDAAKARALLTGIQRRWDEIGRIFPRDAERGLDDELRKIEQGLKSREDADWKSNNPETKARQNDMTQQLVDAIAKLEEEVTAARATNDKSKIAKAEEALSARKAWLKALGG
jgi:hypothetical protein